MKNYMHLALALLAVVMAVDTSNSASAAIASQPAIAASEPTDSAHTASATSPSTPLLHPNHDATTPAQHATAKSSSSFPPGLEWMKGRSGLVIQMVVKGRLDINNLPPPGQDHLIYPQFEDVVQAEVRAVPFGSDQTQTTTYRDVYGRTVGRERYEAYVESEKRMKRPFCGQLDYLVERGGGGGGAGVCGSGSGMGRRRAG